MRASQRNLRTGLTYWQSRPVPRIPVRPLRADRHTDVIVIGAGMTGAMAAEALSAAGWRVTLVDRRGPLQGATAATTALLQYEIDVPLTVLQHHIGHTHAARAWRRSKLGLESLAAKVQALGIRCAYTRVPSLYLAGPLLDAAGLAHECQARNAIGLHTEYLTRQALQARYGITRGAALRSFDTLSVDPLKLAAGFLRRALVNGAQLFAPVTVEDVECGPAQVAVRTSAGPILTARYVVYAMGYETPQAVRPPGHTVHATYAIATQPQPQQLWPDKCHIWEAARTRPFTMRPHGTPCSRPKPPGSSTNSAGYGPSWIVTRPLPGAAPSARPRPACRPSAPSLTNPAALRSWRLAATVLRIVVSPLRSLPRTSPARPMWMPICLPFREGDDVGWGDVLGAL
jgi:NAD(P)-dependent dehydrogenase (short-subunit alcohol dehydrogenase family)